MRHRRRVVVVRMSNDTGGAAFPTSNYQKIVPISTGYSEGMTLRDYFAAKAMQGMTANKGWFGGNNPLGKSWSSVEAMADDYAKEAYSFADAMLKAREE